MKKTKTKLFSLLVVVLVVFPAALWHQSRTQGIGTFEYFLVAFVVIALIFGLVKSIKRMNDEKKGLAVDDELSNMINQKAGLKAFQLSIIWWTLILIFTNDDVQLPMEIPIGLGVLGMLLLFFGFRVYYLNNSVQNENKD